MASRLAGKRRRIEQEPLVLDAQIVRHVEDVRDDGQFDGGARQADVDVAERRRMRRGGRRRETSPSRMQMKSGRIDESAVERIIGRAAADTESSLTRQPRLVRA